MSASPRAGYRLNTYPGGCVRPSAVNNPSFHVARRQLQPNDAVSNSPGIDTTLLDPAPVFVAKFSGPSQLELSTQRDRISYPSPCRQQPGLRIYHPQFSTLNLYDFYIG